MPVKFAWLTAGLAERAIQRIVRDGVPPRRRSTKFDLVLPDGGVLPPKLVISEAAKIAGINLTEHDFAGGNETNSVLSSLDFQIWNRRTGTFTDGRPARAAAGGKTERLHFAPTTTQPQQVVVAALKSLGGIGHIDQIVDQCAALGFPQPESSIRRLLQQFSSDAIWTKARKPADAQDLFYSVEGVEKRTGYWGLRGFLASAPQSYPITGLMRQHSSLLSRAETSLDRMKGIALSSGRISAIEVRFSPDSEYPNTLLDDGRIEICGEGRLTVQPANRVNRSMLQAITSGDHAPVYQSIGAGKSRRYAFLGLYRVTSSESRSVQLAGRRHLTDAFIFTLTPAVPAAPAGVSMDLAREPDDVTSRGGFEQPQVRSIADEAPSSTNSATKQHDPEVRRQALERRNHAHHRLVKALQQRAESAALSVFCDQYADMLCDGNIFEMKSVEGDAVRQVRAAIGQLYHYMFIHRNVPGYEEPGLYAVFDKEIDGSFVEYLTSKVRIGVIWLNPDGSFDADSETRAKLPWLSA